MAGNQWDGEHIPGLGWCLVTILVSVVALWALTAVYVL